MGIGIESMFRMCSGIDQSAHLQRVQVWFEITDCFCVEVSRNSIFLQDYKHIKLLGLLKREILLMLIVAISFLA